MASIDFTRLETWFLAFTAFVYALVLHFVARKLSPRMSLVLRFGLLVWLSTVLFLANRGTFADSGDVPPPLAPALAFGVLLWIFLARSWKVGTWLKKQPDSFVLVLTSLQAFRIGVEYFIARLIEKGTLPPSLTLGGTNYDIVVGLLAPVTVIASILLQRRSEGGRAYAHRLLVGFQWLGIGILTVTIISGALSIPGPLQAWNFDTPNVAMTQFPYVLIPTFFVPIAISLHIIALRTLSYGRVTDPARDLPGSPRIDSA